MRGILSPLTKDQTTAKYPGPTAEDERRRRMAIQGQPGLTSPQDFWETWNNTLYGFGQAVAPFGNAEAQLAGPTTEQILRRERLRRMTVLGQPGLSEADLKSAWESALKDIEGIMGPASYAGWTTGEKVGAGVAGGLAALALTLAARRLGIKIPGTGRVGPWVAKAWSKIPGWGRSTLGWLGPTAGIFGLQALLQESPERAEKRATAYGLATEMLKRRWDREDQEKLLAAETASTEKALQYKLAMHMLDTSQAREQAKTDLVAAFMDRYYEATQQHAANLAAILGGAR